MTEAVQDIYAEAYDLETATEKISREIDSVDGLSSDVGPGGPVNHSADTMLEVHYEDQQRPDTELHKALQELGWTRTFPEIFDGGVRIIYKHEADIRR